jgi:hypothetical protein
MNYGNSWARKAVPERKVGDLIKGTERPEHQLLLYCAVGAMHPAQVARARALLQRQLDWEYLIPFAIQHRMAPLLYFHLRALHSDLVPPASLAFLQTYFEGSLRRNLALMAELRQLFVAFTTAGVAPLSYKGLVLAEAAYRNLSLRPIADLDLLVRRQDLPGVCEVLQKSGYSSETPCRLQPHLQQVQCEASFVPLAGEGTVEVHWAVVPSHHLFELKVEELWERQVPAGFAPQIPTLGQEDTLLVLCAHGLKHRWARLELISTLAQLLRVGGKDGCIDWPVLLARAEASNARHMLQLGLALALDLARVSAAPIPVPSFVIRQIRSNRRVRSQSRAVWETIFETSSRNLNTSFIRRQIFQLSARSGLRNRLRYSVGLVRLKMTAGTIE